MLENEFTFWPVGQGLFYTGIIGDFVFVYDVGTKNKKEFLENQIDSFSDNLLKITHDNSRAKIDVLFLSHYDIDHISGIKMLISKQFQIKKIIAPLITPLTELNFKLESLKSQNEFVVNNDLRETLDSLDTKIIFISPLNADENLDNNDHDTISDAVDITSMNENDFSSTKSASGIIKAKYNELWHFEFFAQSYEEEWVKEWLIHLKASLSLYNNIESDLNFNLDLKAEKKKKTELLASEVHTMVNDNFLSHNRLKILLNIIKCVAKNLNIIKDKANVISLILYHKPLIKEIETDNNAQLLTGDSVFQNSSSLTPTTEWEIFEKKISHFTDICVMLLPHHGSKYGWNDALTKYTNYFIVSYGKHNSYHHPNLCVTKKIDKRKLIRVNEESNTKLTIKFLPCFIFPHRCSIKLISGDKRRTMYFKL
ncbi:MBL fold metallo-hydrolase [Leuconostoc mesenteroides]|uniref:MBL fold metallo-hydrolase n=1 Tax=Leuconostoc mesenteroides TaxID=1245 RepID=UPI0011439729|nr:MBL fold metallo-hydrolase [Leuconostoc mesenteroides]GEA92033.1 hypothetical protein LME01_17690 [Leuconostoc mesenteroides subsp. mesenteroides]